MTTSEILIESTSTGRYRVFEQRPDGFTVLGEFDTHQRAENARFGWLPTDIATTPPSLDEIVMARKLA